MQLTNDVLLVEDNEYSALISENIESIKGYHFEVYRATDFEAANEYALTSPGIQNFAFIILDLNIPYEEEEFTVEEKEDLAKLSDIVELSGWIWLKRILSVFPDIESKVIVLSAYIDVLPEHEKSQYKRITFIDKNDLLAINQLGNKLLQATR